MITPAQHAEIRRLYYAEHWRVGTIAAQLGVHHETVAAALNRASVLTQAGRCRATALDPYLPFVRDTLTQYPRLRATRLHEMLRGGVRVIIVHGHLPADHVHLASQFIAVDLRVLHHVT